MNRYALAFLANDRFLKWAITFLESVRARDATLPLYCIPHSGATAQIRGLRQAFGFEVLEEGLDRLDAFAQRLFPRQPRHRANLRKYAALTLPVDEVGYFDVDAIMLVPPSRLFGHIRQGQVDFVYLATSPVWVYAAAKIELARAMFPDMRLISAGAFVTSPKALTIDEVITTVENNFELYRTLRRSRVYDQPVLNFVLHRLGKRCRHISEVDGRLVGLVSPRNPQLHARGGSVQYGEAGGDVVAVHWAGDARRWYRRINPRTRAMQRLHDELHARAIRRIEGPGLAAVRGAPNRAELLF